MFKILDINILNVQEEYAIPYHTAILFYASFSILIQYPHSIQQRQLLLLPFPI